MNKESFLMYIRDDNYMPIGAIMVQRIFADYGELHKVAVSLCHPKEVHKFRKETAWNILNGKMLSESQTVDFTSEALLDMTLDEIFLEFGIKHLEKVSSAVHGFPSVRGNVDEHYAETQLEILRNNTERFHRTFKMMIEEKVSDAL